MVSFNLKICTQIKYFGIRLREVEFSAYSTWKTKRFFWRTRLRKTKGIFGVLALGNEKPKGMPDVWMMESKRTDTLWVPSDIGFRFRCSRIPKRKMFRCSRSSSAPGFRNGKMSPSRVSLESENDSSGILDFDRFWESD
ncbi:unnamed protein product [Rhizophagus irregularis]|nr:unnamed protein product [Rhizophagus irregularis]